jgi:hypothetical protein
VKETKSLKVKETKSLKVKETKSLKVKETKSPKVKEKNNSTQKYQITYHPLFLIFLLDAQCKLKRRI